MSERNNHLLHAETHTALGLNSHQPLPLPDFRSLFISRVLLVKGQLCHTLRFDLVFAVSSFLKNGTNREAATRGEKKKEYFCRHPGI